MQGLQSISCKDFFKGVDKKWVLFCTIGGKEYKFLSGWKYLLGIEKTEVKSTFVILIQR